jgi:hypothetical protein
MNGKRPDLRIVRSAPPMDPLLIARSLGDKEMASAILDERASRPDLYDSLAASQVRGRLFERLRDPAFLRGALVGFALGQILVLALAIIIARVVNG